jgi:hypothetical protein
MRYIDRPLTERDSIAIRVADDWKSKSNLEYSDIVFGKVGLLLELMDSLFRQQIAVPDWQTWSEPLIYKLCFHSTSITRLYEGCILPFENNRTPFKILDEPSIIALLRVATENYLTFYYLYADKVTDEEKQFRLAIWRYCGIKQRVGFEITTDHGKAKQAEESILLESLKQEILNSPLWNGFDKRKQEKILKGIKPRLFNSWIDLIKLSGLRMQLFKNMYGYKSNYSHSEFISVLQLKSGNYQFNPQAKMHFPLFLLHCIVCKAVVDLKTIFPSINTLFESKSFKIKAEVEIARNLAVDNSLDAMNSQL